MKQTLGLDLTQHLPHLSCLDLKQVTFWRAGLGVALLWWEPFKRSLSDIKATLLTEAFTYARSHCSALLFLTYWAPLTPPSFQFPPQGLCTAVSSPFTALASSHLEVSAKMPLSEKPCWAPQPIRLFPLSVFHGLLPLFCWLMSVCLPDSSVRQGHLCVWVLLRTSLAWSRCSINHWWIPSMMLWLTTEPSFVTTLWKWQLIEFITKRQAQDSVSVRVIFCLQYKLCTEWIAITILQMRKLRDKEDRPQPLTVKWYQWQVFGFSGLILLPTLSL